MVQAQRATVTGAVTDPQGAAVSGTHVVLLNLDQGLERETVTAEDGNFLLPLLQPGRYVLTAQKAGFAVAEVKEIILHVGDIRSFPIQLEVGGERVQIHVLGQSQQVETVSPALGQLVTSDVIRNAPLDGRNVLQLALLQPGVTPTDPDDLGGTFNITGNRSDSVSYLFDGGLNNNLIDNGVVYNPNPDTVSEFRILTSNYPAEFGRNGGGVISVATRSGTNLLHGSLFNFLRNDALNANSFFNKNTGLPRNDLKRNQFGGTLGGPITIPSIVDGHDRFFFFVGYQGQRQVRGLAVHNVPTFTPAELNGDFSHATSDGTADPGVAAFLQSHPFFALNANQAIIDPTRINSVARNYIAAGLVPTSPTGSLSSQGRSTSDRGEITTRLDFEISPKDKLSATFGRRTVHVLVPFDFADVPGFPDSSNLGNDFLDVSYVRIVNPNLLNEVRASAQRATNTSAQPALRLPLPGALGIAITPDLPTGPTNLLFDNGLAIGFSELGPQRFANNTFAYSDTLSWNRGRHNWKFGAGFSPFQDNTFYAFIVNGQFFFAGPGGAGSQNALADFLLGIPTFFTQSPAARSTVRTKYTDGFAQDQWHIAKNLVLTLGLRYEYNTPKSDTLGRTFSIIPGLRSVVFPHAPPGMVFPGDPGAPRGANFPDGNNWAPRFGFAWNLFGTGRTSLRGGFGMFYDILKAEDNLQFNGQPPFYSSTGFPFTTVTGNSAVNYMSQPFLAAGVPNPFPSRLPPSSINFAAAGFLPIGSSQSVFVVDPHLRTPYVYHYNLSLQNELAKDTILELSYAGSSSHGLTALVDINPFVLGTGQRVLNMAPAARACSPYLCYGLLPQFRNTSNANYNSLEASLEKQFSNSGIFARSYFTLAYNYSHNIDDASGFRNRNSAVPYYNPGLFRASADMDLRHRIVFSGGWEVPFDRVWEPAPSHLSRGWRLFPILSWQTGFPIDVLASLPSDVTRPGPSGAGDVGLGLIRANLVGPVQIFDPHRVQNFAGYGQGNQGGNYWFNPTTFNNSFPSDQQVEANPALRTYGTLPRNFIRGPGRFNIDLALSKTTPLSADRLNLEVRADFFNIFNFTEFQNPNTNIADPSTFGQITDTYSPRIIQLALRLTF